REVRHQAEVALADHLAREDHLPAKGAARLLPGEDDAHFWYLRGTSVTSPAWAGQQPGTLVFMLPRLRRLALGAASLAIATAVWLPCLHWLYAPPAALARVEKLAAHQLALFRDGALHDREAVRMRRTNPEW